MQVEKFGSTSSEATETKGLLSVIYIQLGEYKEAHRCLKEVSKWQQQNFDKHHPALSNTKNYHEKIRIHSLEDRIVSCPKIYYAHTKRILVIMCFQKYFTLIFYTILTVTRGFLPK